MAMNICANMFKRPKSIYNMRGKTDSELLQIITNTTPELTNMKTPLLILSGADGGETSG